MSLPEVPAGAPLVPRRRGPAMDPMVLPQPMLVPVIDANALLVMGCDMVKRDRQQDLVTGLAATGRANPHIAAHVPSEIDRHLPRLAKHNKVPEAQVRRLLDEVILPSARLVDLEIRDHLSPHNKRILHVDLELPRDLRGDPDDAPTMALAEFLAPAVIITADSVFTRFGFAASVADWIPIAKDLLRMVGLEADLADAAWLTEFAMRLLASGARELVGLAARHPWWASAALAAGLWFCHRRGYLKGDRWRENAAQLWELAKPLLEKANTALLDQARIRDALIIVEAPAYPIPEQLAARHLARCGRSLTPAELRDALVSRGHQIPAVQLKREMNTHRSFVREPGDRYTVGRPARLALPAS